MKSSIAKKTERLYYPLPVSGIDGFKYSLIFGLFVTLFLWFFEPFDINIQAYSIIELLFFGFISFSVFFVGHTALPFIIPNIYNENNWTIYSQITFYVILSLAIATLNGLYINFRNDLSFSWFNYGLIIVQTFAVGIIPITLSVVLSYYWKYKKIAEQSDSFNEQLAGKSESPVLLYMIVSNIKNETFLIDENVFLYAKANGNYTEVIITNVSPEIYRIGLLDLERQVISSPNIVRCHRSYLVNMKQVSKVTGNAQGLKLWFQDRKTAVPVSRKYIDQVRSVFRNM